MNDDSNAQQLPLDQHVLSLGRWHDRYFGIAAMPFRPRREGISGYTEPIQSIPDEVKCRKPFRDSHFQMGVRQNSMWSACNGTCDACYPYAKCPSCRLRRRRSGKTAAAAAVFAAYLAVTSTYKPSRVLDRMPASMWSDMLDVRHLIGELCRPLRYQLERQNTAIARNLRRRAMCATRATLPYLVSMLIRANERLVARIIRVLETYQRRFELPQRLILVGPPTSSGLGWAVSLFTWEINYE
jgi:hypothetical protein